MKFASLSLRARSRPQPAPGEGREPVVLTQNRVYILPSRMGGMFCLTLGLMLLGSINYNLGLGYVLTFLLAGVGVVSLLHTWRNLAGLDIRPGRQENVFAGDHVRFRVSIRNPTELPRFAVGLRRNHEFAQFTNVPARDESESFVEMVAQARGWLEPGRMEIATSYPLGLFRAWSYLRFSQRALVYPRPETGAPPVPSFVSQTGSGPASAGGEDDFAGLRDYQRGDSLKRIAWKAMARRDMPVTKEFSGGQSRAQLRLDWRTCPQDFDTERRLSRLAAWVVRADASGMPYSLHIPGMDIPVASGPAHRDRCLEVLALFGR